METNLQNIAKNVASICGELLSDKLIVRNKAVTKLNSLLSSPDLSTDYSASINIDWSRLFNNSIESIVKHSRKFQPPQILNVTQRNSIIQYSSLLNKILTISIDLENFIQNGISISSKIVYQGICTLYNESVTRNLFCNAILQIIDTIFLSFPEHFSDLTQNEFTELFSLIFHYTNEEYKNITLYAFKSFLKIVEIALIQFQCNLWLIDYLPKIIFMFKRMEQEERLIHVVIKLNYTLLNDLMIDHHQAVSKYTQENFSSFTRCYQLQLKHETKNILFSIFELFLDIHHLKVNNITNFNETECIQTLYNIIILEIQNRNFSLIVNNTNDERFEKLSARIILLSYMNKNNQCNEHGTKDKIQKTSTIIEQISKLIKDNFKDYQNPIWFSIFKHIILLLSNEINLSDLHTILDFMNTFLLIKFDISKNIKSLRLICKELLKREKCLYKNEKVTDVLFEKLWYEFSEIISSHHFGKTEDTAEQHIILRLLIKNMKIDIDKTMLILKNAMQIKLKNLECLELVKEIIVVHGIQSVFKYESLSEIGVCMFSDPYVCNELTTNNDTMILLTEIFTLLILNSYNNEDIEIVENDLKPRNNFFLNLEYKYLKRFIFLEQKQEMINKSNKQIRYLSNCINNENFEKLSIYFNLTADQLLQSQINDIIRTSKKIVEIVYLDYSIFMYNVSDVLVRNFVSKTLILFFSNLEMQLKNFNKNSPVEFEDAVQLLKIISLFTKKIIERPDLLVFLQQYIDIISNFIITFTKPIIANSNTDETEIKQLELLKMEILSIFASTHFNNENAFAFIKNYNFLIKNRKDISNKLALLFHTIEYLTFKGLPVSKNVAFWIMNNLKTACEKYHTSYVISNLIIDNLLQIIKSLIDHLNLLKDDLDIIICSFLKKCNKLKYNSEFTIKMFELLKDIATVHPEYFLSKNENRENYFFIGKFFKLSSPLVIQFAVVKFVNFMLDPSNFFINENISNEFIEYSKNLIENLTLKTLCTNDDDNDENVDLIRNHISANIQMLLSLFCLGQTNYEKAFLQLAELCYNQNLNIIDFSEIYQISKYFQCSLSNLSSELIENLISLWLTKKYCIDKIPWWLCSDNEYNFYIEFSEVLVFCGLKYNSKNLIKMIAIKTKLPEEQLMLNVIEKCNSFIMAKKCRINDNPNQLILIEQTIKKYTNLTDINSFPNINIAKLIFYIVENFHDTEIFKEFLGFTPIMETNSDYQLNILQFNESINQVFKFNIARIGDLYTKNPIILIKLLQYIKERIYGSVFLIKKSLYICRYKICLDLLLELFKKNYANSNIDKYFLKDISNFMANSLKDFKHSFCILNSIVKCMTTVFKFFILNKSVAVEVLIIIVSLKEIVETTKFPNIKIEIINFLKDILPKLIYVEPKFVKHIEPLMQNDIIFKHNYESEEENNNNIKTDILNFLNHRTTKDLNSIKKLTLNIFNKKHQFIELIKNDKIFNEKNCSNLLDVLTKQIMTSTEDEAIEISKCLGTIGPIFINNYAFISEENEMFYNSICDPNEAEKSYVNSVLNFTEKMLFNFDLKTYKFVIKLCEKMIKLQIFKNHKINGFFILEPFLDKNSSAEDLIFNVVNFNLINIIKENEQSYDEFLKKLSAKIYSNLCLTDFQNLCLQNIQFSQLTFVPLCSFLLKKSEEFKKNIIELLEYFFERANDAITNPTNSITNIFTDPNTLKLFLEVTECLRISNNFKLPINLLNVSNVASSQRANFLAVIYLETWAIEQLENSNYQITNESIRMTTKFQNIARKAYESIGCTNAISAFLNSSISRFEYLDNSNNYLDLLIELDANNSLWNSQLVCKNLKRNGLFNLSKSLNLENEPDYEINWRLATWDSSEQYNQSNKLEDSAKSLEFQFEKLHFQALKSIYEKDESNTIRITQSARKLMAIFFKECSIECIQNLYKFLTNLKLLKQIEDFSKLQFSNVDTTTQDKILKNWEDEKTIRYGNFHNTEIILAQKLTLFEIAGVRATRKIENFYNEKDAIANNLFYIIDFCKTSTLNKPLIKNYIEKLKNRNCSFYLQAKASLEDAINCWDNGQKNIALNLLQNLMQNKKNEVILPRINAYRLYGQFCGESNKESFDNVHKKYLKQSLCMVEHLNVLQKNGKFTTNDINFDDFYVDTKLKNFKILAELADKEFVQINHHINSTSFQTKMKLMNKNQEDAKQLHASNIKDKDNTITWNILSKNSSIDENEIQYFYNKKNEYLSIAMDNYIKFCKIDSSIFSPAIYRITSMWLSNKTNEKLNELMKQHIFGISSYKFICVLPQLLAHLNCQDGNFINILKKLIINCAIEHPHHSLNHILCLINAYKDDDNNIDHSSYDLRCTLAKKCLSEIKNIGNCSQIIEELEKISLALIDFANQTLINKNNNSISDDLKKFKKMTKTHYMTEFLPISINKDYENITTILEWHKKVELVGGVNAPKKLKCFCSDGKYRIQLLKGKDDMRQDAIMQQFFNFVNNILQDELEPALKIRTYKVVPLSKRSGILEWCDNTIPLGSYLSKNGGAHAKYRPNDWKPMFCREQMKEVQKGGPNARLEVYSKVCKNIQPVLQNFFFENFLLPGIWFERRLTYMNSVAVSSIVGFILGLGDRHLNNILLDYQTAEVVHIDFGIAFEQGKVMPTPETVPFRLTRDILAPMGVCEHNGVFQKSCEKTLKILQKHKQVLTTILEVLVYDPLYCWTSNTKNSNLKKKNLTVAEDQEKNAVAHRALMRVSSKLEGTEDIKIGHCSVETQIEKLIFEATNPQNLSRLFHGWEPYL